MARSALGKRGRVSPPMDQVPRKRTRRQAKEQESLCGPTTCLPQTSSKKTDRQDEEPKTPRGPILGLPQTPHKTRRCLTEKAQSPWVNNEENHDPRLSMTGSEDYKTDEDEDELAAELPRRTRKLHVQSPVVDGTLTPSTPRHRDALCGYPSTPRRAVMSAGKLFRRMTPQSCAKASTVQTVYHSARQLFACDAGPDQLVGRECERKQLEDFLNRCLSSWPRGCIYVSGAPGTGKSAMVTELMRLHSHNGNTRNVYVNCMSINSSKALYDTLLSELGLDGCSSDAAAMETLQQAFCPRTKSSTVYQVTLDEMDHMLTLDLESLYRVMEWSMQKSSRLVLIGIANALDLTDRFLPRLKAKKLKPELLPFLPYTAVQIKEIIVTRLKSLLPADRQDYVPFIHPAAIELCARKVSNQTGDVRKAFEICRRALELVEAETRCKHEDEAREKLLQQTPCKQALSDRVNEAVGDGSCRSVFQAMTLSLGALTAETAPRASIGHINKITLAAFSNGAAQRLRTLNLQQRAALCALVAWEKRARASSRATDAPSTPSKTRTLAPTIKMLFDTYRSLCTWDSVLYPLASSEFREVVSSLETLGLVNTVEGRSGSFMAAQTPSKRGRKPVAASGDERRIASSVSEREVEAVTEGAGAGILRSILAGEALEFVHGGIE